MHLPQLTTHPPQLIMLPHLLTNLLLSPHQLPQLNPHPLLQPNQHQLLQLNQPMLEPIVIIISKKTS